MSYSDHAKKEFHLAGWTDENGKFECDMQALLCKQVLELLDLFSTHGHSGSSAPYAIDLFVKLAKFKIITPLTGSDSEWRDVGNDMLQNSRLSSVFKDLEGKAYDIDGRVYWEWHKNDDGEVYKSHFHKGGDTFYIKFPYRQAKPVEVFCPTDEYPNEKLTNEDK